MSRVVVLHDLGDAAGGAPWREAMEAAGFGDVLAPDLPGHGSAPPPVGGNYVRADAGYLLAGLLRDRELEESVIVGVGHSGWIATIAAVGGHVGRVVLVDGLGRPWRSVEERLAHRRRQTRALLADDDAMAHHRGSGPDPRLRHVPATHGDRALAVEAASLIGIPALIIERELDGLAEVRRSFGGPVTVVRSGCSPTETAVHLGEWLASTAG